MSGFDINPFGNSTTDNPFADPAVQQVASNTSLQLKLDYYNPYEKPLQNAKSTAEQQNNGPAILQPTQELPTFAQSSAQIQQQSRPKPVLTEELRRYQEVIDFKEQEINHHQGERDGRNISYNVRMNNWPPLPKNCCLQPCFYQDIQVDIPYEFQKIARALYYLWIFHGTIMLLNILGGIILHELTVIGMGILYALLFTPFSYICWFRPAYKAFRNDSSFNFMVFFCIFFFQFMVTTIQAVGIPGSGTIGIITVVEIFARDGILHGILGIIIASGFGCAAAVDIYLMSKIHRMYKSTGASMAKAQQEFTAEILHSQHVGNAARNLATATVGSQFD